MAELVALFAGPFMLAMLFLQGHRSPTILVRLTVKIPLGAFSVSQQDTRIEKNFSHFSDV
jgi:hypothetical protein